MSGMSLGVRLGSRARFQMHGNRKSHDPLAIRSARDRCIRRIGWRPSQRWCSYRISFGVFLPPYLRSSLLFFFFSPPVHIPVVVASTVRCADDAELFTNFKARGWNQADCARCTGTNARWFCSIFSIMFMARDIPPADLHVMHIIMHSRDGR